MSNTIILGAGMAGCGAAHELHKAGIKARLFEKHNYIGGHAASFSSNGFVFDDGPHISFTKNERLKKLFAESINHKYEEFSAEVNNYWNGHWVKHPAQVNLHGLPEEMVITIIEEFFKANNEEKGEIRNYKDWLYASFGKTFSDNFPIRYTKRYHTTTADNMDTDWIGPRLYQPDIKEVLRGAINPDIKSVHYVSDFRYPSFGGFVSFLNMFINQADFHLDHELVSLNPETKELTFANNKKANYNQLISSIPLPVLIPMIKSVPDEVKLAAEKLACTTCVIVNVGIDRENLSESHWTYFYDEEFIFTRIAFIHMQSPNNVPSGCGSIQTEIYFSDKYKPLDRTPEECIEPAISDLKKCGLIKEDDTIVFKEARLIKHANVIFDLERQSALSIVHGYLDDIGVNYCGRFGEWGYQWTDDSFLSGENAAKKVLKLL